MNIILYKTIRYLATACMLMCVSACGIVPTGIEDESRVLWESEAYGSVWKLQKEVKKLRTYSIQGDTWQYLKLEKYLANDKGQKIDLHKDIYVLQKNGLYKHYKGDALEISNLPIRTEYL